ncbi:hypothetical protein Ciccas_001611 [Cichlidogyrus casuarinus]|uniref:Peptidase M12B domain-containing protein n=1 Tax=Cichlidogyrus casuarinus TaxID=1844966 RepID=A0ABD2QJM5_9PLAT
MFYRPASRLIFSVYCLSVLRFVISAETVKLHLGAKRDARCPIVAIERTSEDPVYLQETSEYTYPIESRIRDGLANTTDFCLYETVSGGQALIVSLFVGNGSARDAQFDIPSQMLDLNSQNPTLEMEPFSAEPDSTAIWEAKNIPGQFNKPRLLELYAISDKAMHQDDGELLLPNLMVTLATANQMTRAVGIRIQLVHWERWNKENGIELIEDISKSLGDLSAYRFHLNPKTTVNHDSMHLFT